MTPTGFPHSEISGSTLACNSPELFAANHVLHRLLTPRHSPCARSSLVTNLFGTLKGFQTSSSLRLAKPACAHQKRLQTTGPLGSVLRRLELICIATFSIAIRR